MGNRVANAVLGDRSVVRVSCGLLLTLGLGVAGQAHAQAARDYISIVGSSTVYPFPSV